MAWYCQDCGLFVVLLDHIAGISAKNGWNCWSLSQMGDVQMRIWKPRERVLVSDVSKWYDYVSMFVFCFKMGNQNFRKHISSDSER